MSKNQLIEAVETAYLMTLSDDSLLLRAEAEAQLSISEVAYQVGFTHASHFTRAFSGRTAPLKRSDAPVRMTAGEGGLGICASNESGIWQCWNILPPDLDAVGPEYCSSRATKPREQLTSTSTSYPSYPSSTREKPS
jgi:hypothetical protein